MKKLILITLIATALVAFRCNTMRHMHGTVYGSDDKLPIIGATVKIKGTHTGVVTNTNGKYAIDAPEGSALVFSYIGYQSKIIAVKQADSLDAYLDPSNSTLNEVVVTGYGTQRKKDVAGSVAVISMDNIAVASPPLQGQAAGVVVNKGIFHKGKSLGYSASPLVNNTASPQDESYKTINENGFSNAKDNPLSTFSVDVDAASYSNVRRFINNGQLPPPDAVRVEEMINYFKYNFNNPTGSDPVGITTEISSAPWNKNHLLVRIGLKARTVDMDKLPPSNMVFLLDISGSMGEPNKLPLVKASMKMLVDQLRAEDRVAIVVYSGEVAMKLPSTPRR